MKRILFLGLLLVSLLTFPSCQKNNYQTQAQLTATNLIRALGASSGTLGSVNVFNFDDSQLKFSGTSYQISGDGMITVGRSGGNFLTLNLETLKSYQLYSGNLSLFF
jgi:hypothetical protein